MYTQGPEFQERPVGLFPSEVLHSHGSFCPLHHSAHSAQSFSPFSPQSALFPAHPCFNPFLLLWQHATGHAPHKYQKLTVYSSGGRGVQDQGVHRCVYKRLHLPSPRWCPIVVITLGKEHRRSQVRKVCISLFLMSFCKHINQPHPLSSWWRSHQAKSLGLTAPPLTTLGSSFRRPCLQQPLQATFPAACIFPKTSHGAPSAHFPPPWLCPWLPISALLCGTMLAPQNCAGLWECGGELQVG